MSSEQGQTSSTALAKGIKAVLLRVAVLAAIVGIAAIVWYFDALPAVADWFVDDTKYHDEIVAAARRHGLDPDLVRALIFRESRFNPQARGSRGEVGLMQFAQGHY